MNLAERCTRATSFYALGNIAAVLMLRISRACFAFLTLQYCNLSLLVFPMSISEELARLKPRGIKRHKTLRGWAASAGVNPSTLWRWLSGKAEPKVSGYLRLRKAAR